MDDSRQGSALDAVSLGQIFKFHHILFAVTQAMHPSRLLVAFLTLLLLIAGGNLWDVWVDNPTLAHSSLYHELVEAETEGMPVFQSTVNQVSLSFRQLVSEGVLGLSPIRAIDALADLLIRMPVRLWDVKPWFISFYGCFALLVVALGGGALCRMAACNYSGKERLSASDAGMFAFAHWINLFLSPLLPLIVVGVLALCLMILGVLFFGTLPFVDVIGGLFYGINLLLGFLIAFVLIIYTGSFSLILPAVAVENCGPSDAIQRAFAYLLNRPIHLLGYFVTALVGLAVGYFVVSLFATVTLNITGSVSALLPSNDALENSGGFEIFNLSPVVSTAEQTTHEEISSGFVSIWEGIVVLLIAGYVISYFFSSSTIIYMRLRKLVDDQEPSEIWRPGLVPGTLAPMQNSGSGSN